MERSAKATEPKESAAEKRAREAWEVEQEIPPELRAAWDARKGDFTGTPHQRWERFVEWAEAEPGELAAASYGGPETSDDELAAEYEAYAAEQTEQAAPPPPSSKRSKQKPEYGTTYDPITPEPYRAKPFGAIVLAEVRKRAGRRSRVTLIRSATLRPNQWEMAAMATVEVGRERFIVEANADPSEREAKAHVMRESMVIGMGLGPTVERAISMALSEASHHIEGAAA